jgi:hypothetical protein
MKKVMAGLVLAVFGPVAVLFILGCSLGIAIASEKINDE